MPRRARPDRRRIPPDPRHGSVTLQRFINRVMTRGKKSVAERVVYHALEELESRERKPALDIFEQALRNVTPVLEVKPRRVGGATYQVPIEIRSERRMALGMRWLLSAARARGGQPMARRLAAEIWDAHNGQGAGVRRKDEIHRMADASKAFVHYRW